MVPCLIWLLLWFVYVCALTADGVLITSSRNMCVCINRQRSASLVIAGHSYRSHSHTHKLRWGGFQQTHTHTDIAAHEHIHTPCSRSQKSAAATGRQGENIERVREGNIDCERVGLRFRPARRPLTAALAASQLRSALVSCCRTLHVLLTSVWMILFQRITDKTTAIQRRSLETVPLERVFTSCTGAVSGTSNSFMFTLLKTLLCWSPPYVGVFELVPSMRVRLPGSNRVFYHS